MMINTILYQKKVTNIQIKNLIKNIFLIKDLSQNKNIFKSILINKNRVILINFHKKQINKLFRILVYNKIMIKINIKIPINILENNQILRTPPNKVNKIIILIKILSYLKNRFLQINIFMKTNNKKIQSMIKTLKIINKVISNL